MALYKIVVSEVERGCSLKILTLLAESIGEPSQTAHVKASSPIQPLDMAGRGQAHVGTAYNSTLFRNDKFGGAVATITIWGFIVNVGLDDLSEVYGAAEGLVLRLLHRLLEHRSIFALDFFIRVGYVGYKGVGSS